jgi:hypothetical protein
LPKVEVRLFGEDADGALALDGYLRDAYHEAEVFSELLKQRVQGAGFFKTLLLRRLGSSIEAGRRTVRKLLGLDPETGEEDDEEDEEPENGEDRAPMAPDDFKNFTDPEKRSLARCLQLLDQGGNRDPKLEAVTGYLLGERNDALGSWINKGCILFSQYYDTARWFGFELAKRPEFSHLDIGLYAGSNRSGFWRGGGFQRCDRNDLKQRVRTGELTLLLGTDAASEGLNL